MTAIQQACHVVCCAKVHQLSCLYMYVCVFERMNMDAKCTSGISDLKSANIYGVSSQSHTVRLQMQNKDSFYKHSCQIASILVHTPCSL